MPQSKKDMRERIKKQLELVKKLKQKKQEERESLGFKMKGKGEKDRLSSHGEQRNKYTPGHHGNR